jgi:aldehyde dehydrogenase (NAD+)
VIGAKTTFKGEITGDEDILVEGVVEGQIHITKDLRVGPGGVVKAKVQAQSVVVSGEVVGDCSATHRVEIQASGKLLGNIRSWSSRRRVLKGRRHVGTGRELGQVARLTEHRGGLDGAASERQREQPAVGAVGTFADSGPADVERAVAAAREAQPKWKALPAPKRGEILYRAAEILVRRKEDLSRDMTREMGKVLDETRGDVQEAIDMTYYMAGEGRRQFGQTTPSEMPSKFQMSVRQPVGIAGLITPWNFPMAIPSWKMMPALIVGNTVVIKPATDTPLSVVNLLKALEEAGLPKGVVNMVTGGGAAVGSPLMQHKDVGIVSFTGSTGVGRKVSEACAPAFKHCHLEMGGKNVIMVMDDARLDLAVEGAVWGGFGTTGQRCTAASRVVVHKKAYKEFTDLRSG